MQMIVSAYNRRVHPASSVKRDRRLGGGRRHCGTLACLAAPRALNRQYPSSKGWHKGRRQGKGRALRSPHLSSSLGSNRCSTLLGRFEAISSTSASSMARRTGGRLAKPGYLLA